MEMIYEIHTQIMQDDAAKSYLNSLATKYCKIYREAWHTMKSPDFMDKYGKITYYITYLCNKHNVLSRTVAAITRDIQWKQKAVIERYWYEITRYKIKIEAVKSDIQVYTNRVERLKPKVRDNKATPKEMFKYRQYKACLFQKKCKLNRYIQSLQTLRYYAENKIPRSCFGSKKLYKAQWNLAANGYKTREKWHNDFVRARDCRITYIGKADEPKGNQMVQLEYDFMLDKYNIKLRKENNLEKTMDFLWIEALQFKWMNKDLKKEVLNQTERNENKRPISVSFIRKKKKWYVFVTFHVDREIKTTNKNGVAGIDFNNGFLEMTETDSRGNIKSQKHYDIENRGYRNNVKSEVLEKVAKIVKHASTVGKDISIENLDFLRVQSKPTAVKKFNMMVGLLEYSRYKSGFERACFRNGVELHMVNPKNTSIIGRLKYSEKKKLSVHQAASYVIARLGQGYIDKHTIYETIA